MNILVVEDDLNLSEALSEILRANNYVVDVVFDGMDALYYASNNSYDVILLDVLLPKLNGFDVIKMLRKQGIATPTIMLTAKGELSDRVQGLDSGADDYMTKPFEPEELLARLRAMLRRRGEVLLEEIKFNQLTLNLSTHALSTSTKTINLNNKEFQMMELFMRSPNRIITKEQFINSIWGASSEVVDNNVEAYISFLRKKLFYLKIDEIVTIRTIRRVGYKLENVQG